MYLLSNKLNKRMLKYTMSNSNKYRMECRFGDEQFELPFSSIPQIQKLIEDCRISRIVINELVTYPDLFSLLGEILALKYHSELIMLVHDYFCVSPTINLISERDYIYDYDKTTGYFHCDKYYIQEQWPEIYHCLTIDEWRHQWNAFLLECNEVRVFSNDSLKIISNVYPELTNIIVKPHTVDYMLPVNKLKKTTPTLNIGLLGALTMHKGMGIVQKIINELEKTEKNIRIILIGYTDDRFIQKSHYFSQTGVYSPKDLPSLVLENDIDLFLIPSIWLETFCFTAEEIMKMEMPIACFDLGAPAERVSSFCKGCILSSQDPSIILEELVYFSEKLNTT